VLSSEWVCILGDKDRPHARVMKGRIPIAGVSSRLACALQLSRLTANFALASSALAREREWRLQARFLVTAGVNHGSLAKRAG